MSVDVAVPELAVTPAPSTYFLREQDVSAQDVSATRWRKTFRQQNVAETSFTCCEDVSAPKTFRQQEE